MRTGLNLRALTMCTVAATAMLVAGCAYGDHSESAERGTSGTTIASDGSAVTRSYALTGFTGVMLASHDMVTIVRGDSFGVTATGKGEELDQLVLRVRDNGLEIRRAGDGGWWGSRRSHDGDAVQVRVTMPALDKVDLVGSGDITTDILGGNNVDVAIAGSGNLRATGVAAQRMEVAIAGSGNFDARGTADEADVSIAGSGDLAAGTLQVGDARVSIAGSGNVAMRVTGPAEVSILGSGDVTLTGGAQCNKSVVGSGTVTCS